MYEYSMKLTVSVSVSVSVLLAFELGSDFQHFGFVRLPKHLVPDAKNWALGGWTPNDRQGALNPKGWAFSATEAVEAQIYNRTGTFLFFLLIRPTQSDSFV